MRSKRRLNLTKLKQRWPALLLATLLIIVSGVVIVRIAVIFSLGSQAYIAASFAPNHPRVLAATIDRRLLANRGQVTDPIRTMAIKLVRHSPMAEEPMLIAGIDALLANNDSRAKQLLSHALTRNPRSEFARLLSLELDLRSRDARRAVFDMTVLGRLLPDVQAAFVPELARMAYDPRTAPTLATTLRSDPVILSKVLRYLAEHGARPALLLKLAEGMPSQTTREDIEDWRQPLLRAMVARGEAQDARRLWAAFAQLKQAPASDAIYDDSFLGLRGLPPFNWTLTSSEIGAAELDKKGGLQIEYYGREYGELAAELVILPPGLYRLGFRVEGNIHDPQHRLFWRVSCARPDNVVIAELPIADVTFAGKTIARDFTVPADCPAQWVKLAGEPTEFPKIESATVRQIRIVRLGGA